jgi:hypothetical protein
MEEKQDLSVGGPYTPVSLDKLIKTGHMKTKLTLLVDGTGLGIAKDSPECIYVTPEECSKQAIYFSKEKFDGKRIPAYLFRYLSYMFIDDAIEYESDQFLADLFNGGDITEESDDYKYILNLIKYCESNKEAQQVIGMVQLIGGSLRIATKHKSGIKFYLEHPETGLHPKRQSRLMSMLMKLHKEYGHGDLTGVTEDDGTNDNS